MFLSLPNAQARFFPLSFSSTHFSSPPETRRLLSPVSWSKSPHPCSCKLTSFSEPFPHSAADEENVIGDCLVFEDGAFEDPFPPAESRQSSKKPRRPKKPPAVKEEDLIPEEWKEVQAEINMSKKDRRKIAQKLEYGSRIERTKTVRLSDLEEYKSERATKMSQLKPVVLEKPREPLKETMDDSDEDEEVEPASSSSGRVVPRNPRALETIAKGSVEDISMLFTSGDYEPPEDDGKKTSEGRRRKLFTKEEKVLLNRRIPNLFVANSSKWFPLHTLAASGEFYLMDKLLKHSVDINAVDKNGLTALHRAILCKKQAISNYLLRESANPFVRDEEGATLMHYAVRAANIQMIKILILYNVDVNLPDEEGWTPLHLAVQTRRTDVLRLLLIKGADKTVKNQDGLTPLDLCLYSGRDKRTYELIKILKGLPKSK